VTRRYLGYALGIIFFANFLSYLDRQIVSALGTELKAHHHLSNQEFGWVGSAFTIGYMVFAPVVSFLIIRFPRTRIFALCVLVWSVATIGSGFAPNKWILYATRFFIGVGEAGCLVIGPTLLSDFFSKEVRGKVLSVFFLALPLGGTGGYIAGGQLAKHFGWQNAFLIAGLPGFLVGALIWALVEPARGDGEDPHHPKVQGFKPYLDLLSNRTLMLIIVAQAFAVIFLQPLLHFGVNFFENERKMTNVEATTTLGIIALVSGGLGNMLSGILGDWLNRRGVRGAYALLAGVAFTLGLPCLILGFSSTDRLVFLPGIGAGAFFYFLCMPAVNTQIANSVPAAQRAVAYAMAVFILHLLGDTFANPIFGAVADRIGSMQRTFFMFSFALLLAGASCFAASRFAPREEPQPAKQP
jgi:MFS transporter, Spinster family, sphingosine-1-phosphate transporter